MGKYVSAMAADDEEERLWQDYKKTFDKNYATVEEDAARKALFLNKHRKIEEHNAGQHSWTMAHNQFSDLTDAEMQKFMGELSIPPA